MENAQTQPAQNTLPVVIEANDYEADHGCAPEGVRVWGFTFDGASPDADDQTVWVPEAMSFPAAEAWFRGWAAEREMGGFFAEVAV